MEIKHYLWIFAGGGFGSTLRAFLSIALNSKGNFPWGTLLANTLACALFAIIYKLSGDVRQGMQWQKYFLITGFCGGLSTFSTWAFETHQLMAAGHNGIAIMNILISLTLGIALFWIVFRAFSL